jgi:hypothetical protein
MRKPVLYLSFQAEVLQPIKGFEPSKIREEKAAALNLLHAFMRYVKNIIKGT